MTQKEYDDKRKELAVNFIENLSIEDLVRLHNVDCEINGCDMQVYANYSTMFDEMTYGMTPSEIVRAVQYGGYDVTDQYFYFRGGTDIYSFNYLDDENCPIYIGDIAHGRDADDLIGLLDKADVDHDDLDEELDELEEKWQKQQFMEEWEKRQNDVGWCMMNFPNGYCVIKYDADHDNLEALGLGIKVDIDYYYDFDDAWNELHDKIIDDNPELENEE